MIDNISGYIEPIIILIVVITILELILPKNKNKKYVMFVCSVVIMISVVNPLIEVFNSDIDISNIIGEITKQMHEVEYSSATNYGLEHNIYNTYIENLEKNMILRLEDMGYEVLESKINVNKDTYEPETVELRVKYDDGYIQPVVIDVFESISNEEIASSDINKIKDTFFNDYGIEKNKIKIN